MIFSSHYENIILYFDSKTNIFTDEWGNVIYDIYTLLSPGRIRLFKESSRPVYICPDVTNRFNVEIVHL